MYGISMNSSFKCRLLELSILPPKKVTLFGARFSRPGPFYPEKFKFLIFFLDFSFKALSETVEKFLGIDLLEGEITPQKYIVFAIGLGGLLHLLGGLNPIFFNCF